VYVGIHPCEGFIKLITVIDIAGDQYLTGLTLYFIGYVLFEIPCNVSKIKCRRHKGLYTKPGSKIILKKTTPRIWLPTLTLIWGVVATLLGIVQNYSGYLSSRFFLGVAESGLFPGVVFYLSMWYKRNEQHYRVALFFSAASLAGAFGGILAWVSSIFSFFPTENPTADNSLGHLAYERCWRSKWLEMDFHSCKFPSFLCACMN
jgi:MFS family permease